MDDKNEQMLLVARKTGDKEERRVLNGRCAAGCPCSTTSSARENSLLPAARCPSAGPSSIMLNTSVHVPICCLGRRKSPLLFHLCHIVAGIQKACERQLTAHNSSHAPLPPCPSRAPESVVADFLSGPPGYEPYQDTGMELQVCPVTTASTLCAVMRGELAPRALVGIVDVREVDQPSARYGVFVYLKPLARGSSGNTGAGRGRRGRW